MQTSVKPRVVLQGQTWVTLVQAGGAHWLIFHLSASHKCPLKLSLLTYRWWIIFNYKTYLYKKTKEQSLKRKKQQSHSSLKAEHHEACDNSPHRKAFQAGWFSAVILRSVISTPFLCWASNPCSHHAAFHSGNHEWSLWGLKQSFGDWMQPGNQPQLEEGWCKTATSAPWDILFTAASGSPFFSTSFPHSGDCCNLSLSARTLLKVWIHLNGFIPSPSNPLLQSDSLWTIRPAGNLQSESSKVAARVCALAHHQLFTQFLLFIFFPTKPMFCFFFPSGPSLISP